MTKNKHLEITIIIDDYIDPKYNIEETQVTEIMNTGVLQSDWNLNYWHFGVVKQKKKERSTTSLSKFKATSLKLWCHRVRKIQR